MRVCSVDIGSKNFAFVISEFNEKHLKTLKCTNRFNKNGTTTEEYKCVLNEVYKNGKILHYINIDLTKNIPPTKLKSYLHPDIFRNMIAELDKCEFLKDLDTVLVEQQVSFGKKVNVKALKIGAHCFNYFLMRYSNIEVIEFPAYNKTKVLGAPKGLTKYQRKKWSVEEAKYILNLRKDEKNLADLSNAKKKDDLADTLTQLQAFKVLRYLDEKL